MSTARDAVLGRIRTALAEAPPTQGATAAPGGGGAPEGPGDADRFAERVADYSATVTRCGPADADVAAAVAEAAARHGATRLAVPAGLPVAWIPDAVEPVRDEPSLDVATLDTVDGALTGAALGIAETGTVVLDGGPASGRRALSLVPDLHVCVVRAADVVDSVPAAFTRLGAGAADRPITFVSGPSATSDIELRRVEGVHGPRRLEVVVSG